jgi:hypothetical protein
MTIGEDMEEAVDLPYGGRLLSPPFLVDFIILMEHPRGFGLSFSLPGLGL